MDSLFAHAASDAAPLPDRLRPEDLAGVVGQEHLTAADAPLGRMLASGQLSSIILWGPPGCGKTTLARILARHSRAEMEFVSAITTGVADLKKLFDKAAARLKDGKRTVLFVDEIHRFNRAQQDVFLPYVENGTVILIGATTENPSFELNSALLSRCRVLVLKRLDEAAMRHLLQRANALQAQPLPLDAGAFVTLCAMADGDGRYFLTLVDELTLITSHAKDAGTLTSESVIKLLQQRAPIYDKSQESHYNLISALHKSLRGSDVDAALYWLHRMLDGGEAPLYVIRRLVRFAVEDIGMADPQAVHQALAAKDVYDFLGSPEGELAIAQATIYLATAPKSNAAYMAHKAALQDARQKGSLMPPAHILNAPTRLMKDLGYGKGYEYDHNAEDGFSCQNYFPDSMPRRQYYQPVERGFERDIIKRLKYWHKLREKKSV